MPTSQREAVEVISEYLIRAVLRLPAKPALIYHVLGMLFGPYDASLSYAEAAARWGVPVVSTKAFLSFPDSPRWTKFDPNDGFSVHYEVFQDRRLTRSSTLFCDTGILEINSGMNGTACCHAECGSCVEKNCRHRESDHNSRCCPKAIRSIMRQCTDPSTPGCVVPGVSSKSKVVSEVNRPEPPILPSNAVVTPVQTVDVLGPVLFDSRGARRVHTYVRNFFEGRPLTDNPHPGLLTACSRERCAALIILLCSLFTVCVCVCVLFPS
jgi:hypothetical protein